MWLARQGWQVTAVDVDAQYRQSPVELPREEVLRRARDVVAPRGPLLVVGHLPPWAAQQHSHPHPQVELPSAAEVLAALQLPEEQRQTERVGMRSARRPDPTAAWPCSRTRWFAVRHGLTGRTG